jgi:hypothetical protein
MALLEKSTQVGAPRSDCVQPGDPSLTVCREGVPPVPVLSACLWFGLVWRLCFCSGNLRACGAPSCLRVQPASESLQWC